MICESCGMPMEKPEDHGGGKEDNSWCKYCCKEDGSHKSKEEVREGVITFMMSEEGEKVFGKKFESREEAEKAADEHIAKMPAWKEETTEENKEEAEEKKEE